MVGGDAEGRVLFGELLESEAHLVLLGLGLRLDGDVDNRVGELHGLEDNRCVLVAEGVTRGGVLQADDGNDIASGADVDVDTVVGVHLQQTADALFLVLASVADVEPDSRVAGVDAQIGQLADEGVGSLILKARAANGALDRSGAPPLLVLGLMPLMAATSVGVGM